LFASGRFGAINDPVLDFFNHIGPDDAFVVRGAQVFNRPTDDFSFVGVTGVPIASGHK
jgi:hypothetical protein